MDDTGWIEFIWLRKWTRSCLLWTRYNEPWGTVRAENSLAGWATVIPSGRTLYRVPTPVAAYCGALALQYNQYRTVASSTKGCQGRDIIMLCCQTKTCSHTSPAVHRKARGRMAPCSFCNTQLRVYVRACVCMCVYSIVQLVTMNM